MDYRMPQPRCYMCASAQNRIFRMMGVITDQESKMKEKDSIIYNLQVENERLKEELSEIKKHQEKEHDDEVVDNVPTEESKIEFQTSSSSSAPQFI